MKIIKAICWAIFWFVSWVSLLAGIFWFYFFWMEASVGHWENWPYNWPFISGAVVMVLVTTVVIPVLFKIGSRALRTEEKTPLVCLVFGAALSSVMLIMIPVSIGILFVSLTLRLGGD